MEDAGCAIQRTTLHERWSLLRSCTLWDDALPAALGTFGVHSQAGDKMQQSSAVTMKTILDEDARKAVGAWVAPFTGQRVVLSVLAKNCDCQTDPRPSLHGGTLCDSICVALSCSGGDFSPHGLYEHSWASVTPMAGKYTTNFSQYTSGVVCVHVRKLFLSWRGAISLPCPDRERATAPHSLVRMLDVITDYDVLCDSRKRGAGHSIQCAAERGPHFGASRPYFGLAPHQRHRQPYCQEGVRHQQGSQRLKATATTILGVVFISCLIIHGHPWRLLF